jgi:hypothetical protein
MAEHVIRPASVASPESLPEVCVGDEVVYRATTDKWVVGEVIEVRGHDELGLTCCVGEEVITQRATHGSHVFGWLTYDEAARR